MQLNESARSGTISISRLFALGILRIVYYSTIYLSRNILTQVVS